MADHIRIRRDLVESEIMQKPPLYLKVWLWLTLRGDTGGRITATIPQAQKAMSYYVGYRKITPTRKEMRLVFEWLRESTKGHTKGHAKGHTKGHFREYANPWGYCDCGDKKTYEGPHEGPCEGPCEGPLLPPEKPAEKAAKRPKIPYAEVVDYLNERAGTKYRACTEGTRKLIRARWSEGYRLGDFQAVIDSKVLEWASDPRMCKFIRPQTLFGTKFESYVNQPAPGNGGRKPTPAEASIQRYLQGGD